jgi:glycosyltransferase involved in cell wall biosynthesis
MERVLDELVRRVSGDVDFVVISRSLPEYLRPLVEWHRVRVPAWPYPLKMIGFCLAASLKLARVDVDLVHTTGALVVNRTDVASVHLCHAGFRRAAGGLGPSGGPLLRRLNTGIARILALGGERWCYRPGRVATLAAVSPGVAAELARHYPGIPIALTPNGVDLEVFRDERASRARERTDAHAEDSAVIALFVGGDWDWKGLGLVIEGLALACRSGAEMLSLWVVGQGDTDRFRGLARRLGVEERVRFLGFRHDVQCCYQAADVLVLPSLYETFSLVAYEAAACGLPVVGTDCHGIRELVGQEEAGVLVARTAEAVGRALALLASDAALRARMGEAGQRRCNSFTWDRSAHSVLDLYRDLLSSMPLARVAP